MHVHGNELHTRLFQGLQRLVICTLGLQRKSHCSVEIPGWRTSGTPKAVHCAGAIVQCCLQQCHSGDNLALLILH